MKGFEGLYTALITPFRNGKIDFYNLAVLLEAQIAGGVDGVVPCGTTGESPTLSNEEHSELIKKTVEIVNGRVSVIAGTGSNSTSEAVALSKKAETDGVDGLLIVNPYYNKPNQKGLYLHYKAVANSVKIPIILYNIPGRTGVNLTVETIQKLASIENVVSVKEAAGSVAQMTDIIYNTPDDFTLISGDDNLLLPCLSVGGKGIISVLSNLLPAEVKKVVSLHKEGKIEEARKQFFKIYPLCRAMFLDTNPIPVKKAMELLGLSTSELRLPLTPLEDENIAILKSRLDDFKKA